MGGTLVRLAALALALPVLANITAAAGDTPPLSGVWMTERLSQITIRPCAEGHCGYVTKVVVPPEIYEKNRAEIDQAGAANLSDENNKNPLLRERPIQGLQILTLDGEKAGRKYRGEVYNPEDGNTYTGFVEVLDDDKIRLTGCGFFALICKSEDWSRVR